MIYVKKKQLSDFLGLKYNSTTIICIVITDVLPSSM